MMIPEGDGSTSAERASRISSGLPAQVRRHLCDDPLGRLHRLNKLAEAILLPEGHTIDVPDPHPLPMAQLDRPHDGKRHGRRGAQQMAAGLVADDGAQVAHLDAYLDAEPGPVELQMDLDARHGLLRTPGTAHESSAWAGHVLDACVGH